MTTRRLFDCARGHMVRSEEDLTLTPCPLCPKEDYRVMQKKDLRPTRDEVLMENAISWAQRSTCSRAQVGVVIAREGRVLVTGYNGAPAGMAHCSHDPSEKSSGEGRESSGCREAVHAEANAIAYAARHGVALKGAELFSTFSPCLACAQLIINAGLSRVVVALRYRDPSGLDLLRNAGIAVDDLPMI